MIALLALILAGSPADAVADCTPIEKTINGTSLQGQLMPGQKVMALPASCHPPQRMDFVIFTSDETDHLVIKQVWGMPGDILTVDQKGHVFVNGEQALTPFDKPYVLKPFFAKRLRKYEGPLKAYLALGHPGSLDSGRMGPIPLEQIVGVVERNEGRARGLHLKGGR